MEEKLKIDPHVHSKGISLCSRVTVEEIIDEKKRLGYDGMVLTNHCQPWYYPPEEHKNYVERVIEEFERAKAYGEERDFRVYLGLEVTLREPHYADWLLYGVTEEFLRRSPCLYRLTQKELFERCEEVGALLIQAHPFREGQSPCAPVYMHGVEINASKGDLGKAALVEDFARAHDLLVTCGTDYHGREQTYFGGIYLPKTCLTAADVAAHVRQSGEVKTFQNGALKCYKSAKFVGK